MSNRTQPGRKPRQGQQQPKQSQQAPRQAGLPPKPKPSPVQSQALAAQEAARREARLQRQAEERAQAARRRQQATLRRYGIMALAAVVAIALVAWLVMREAGKPGEATTIMLDRQHLTNATDPHTPYNTDPPTSGPHTDKVPAFQVYATPIPKEEQVHGLEDGAVVFNYQPELDKATLAKLEELARLYLGTPGKNRIIMSPYPGLSHPIVLTTWGRIDRLSALDESRIRNFVEAYVNIDHHEGSDGQRLP